MGGGGPPGAPPPRPPGGGAGAAGAGAGAAGEERICRICLEGEGEGAGGGGRGGGGGLIAPCLCAGSQRWVHRACLDEWRAVCEDRAFSRCTECLAPYHITVSERAARRGGWPRGRFLLLLARDFAGAFLAAQAVVCGLGAAAGGADALRGRGRPGGAPLLAAAARAGLLGGGASAGGGASPPPFCWGAAVLYYLCGLLSAFVLLGVGAALRWCRDAPREDEGGALALPGEAGATPAMERPLLYADPPPKRWGKRRGRRPPPAPPGEALGRNHCALCCGAPSSVGCCEVQPIYLEPRHGGVAFVNRDDGIRTSRTVGFCRCSSMEGGSGCGNCCCCCDSEEGGLLFLAAAAALFATVGVFVALFWTQRFLQRSMRRHAHVLHKRVLASDYVVADLSLPGAPAPPLLCPPGPAGPGPGGPAPPPQPPPPPRRAGEPGPAPAQAAMQAEAAPSAPPLELMDEHARHLVQWGLL